MSESPLTSEGQQSQKSPNQSLSPNPFAGAANVILSVPETVEIRLVDATTLNNYEIFLFLAGILCNAVVGFWVAYCQSDNAATSASFKWCAITFTALFVVAFVAAMIYRWRLQRRSRRETFKLGQAIKGE